MADQGDAVLTVTVDLESACNKHIVIGAGEYDLAPRGSRRPAGLPIDRPDMSAAVH